MTRGAQNSLQSIVGKNVYSVWMDMLTKLVPNGRTHRLAPMIAAMLQYAFTIAEEKFGDEPEEGTVAYTLINASEAYEPAESPELLELIEQLFEDAGVGYQRSNRRGEGYSIAENAFYEFVHWYDMPWEA